jgi:hypothetical protein
MVCGMLFKSRFTWGIQYDIIILDEDVCLSNTFKDLAKFMSITVETLTQSTLAGVPLLPLLRDMCYGIAGLIVVLFYHGSSINFVIVRFEKYSNQNLKNKQYNRVFLHFYLSFLFIAVMHLIEIVIWAIYITQIKLIDSGIDALMFAGSCYTTVGFVPDILPNGWKSFAFFISFSGLFSIAWTTSVKIGMTNSYKAAWNLKHHVKDPTPS